MFSPRLYYNYTVFKEIVGILDILIFYIQKMSCDIPTIFFLGVFSKNDSLKQNIFVTVSVKLGCILLNPSF